MALTDKINDPAVDRKRSPAATIVSVNSVFVE